MSRYFKDLTNGGHIAYGFDYAFGPFFQRFQPTEADPEGLVEDLDYVFSEGHHFDCYALAHKLHELAEAGHIERDVILAQHLVLLSLDMPI